MFVFQTTAHYFGSDIEGGWTSVSQWVGRSVIVSLSSPPDTSCSCVNHER